MRKKFLTVCFLLIFIISLSLGLIVNKRVKDNYIEMEVKMGLSQVNLINMYFSRRTEIETPLYRLAQVLENKSEYRVTFVNEEGIPVADSQDNSIILESNRKKYNIKEKNENLPYYKIVKSLSKDVEVLEIYTEIFNLNGKKIRLVFSKELKFLKYFQKNIIITILLGILVCFMIYKDKIKAPIVNESSYPVEACNYILENIDIENMRIFNEYNYGSYMLYRGIPVFIDSRADLYTPEFNGKKNEEGKYVGRDIFSDCINISNISTYYENKFEQYGITHVLIRDNSKLNMFLSRDKEHYKELYSDDSFVLYERVEE